MKKVFLNLLYIFLIFFYFYGFTSAEIIDSTEGKHFEKISSISMKDGKKIITFSGGSSLSLESVIKITFTTKKESHLLDGDLAIVMLSSGDILKGSLQKGSSLDITLLCPDIGEIQISLDYLRGIFFLDHLKSSKEKEEFFSKLSSQTPQQDQIFLKKGGQIPGVIQSILPEQVQIQVSGVGNKQMDVKDISALQIAPLGAAFSLPQTPYAKVYLNRGEVIIGEVLQYEKDSLSLKTFFGKNINIPYSRLCEIYFFNGNFIYLSDLKPSSVQVNQGMSTMSGLKFMPRYDESVMGKELKISGLLYRKGLGLHSQTRLTYEIEGKYSQISGIASFDDSVREVSTSYPPKIVLRIYGDGKKIYESGILTPQVSSKSIIASIANCQKLMIEVDFGEPYDDVLGRLNFVDVVLVKK
jgi:hypothetical protein